MSRDSPHNKENTQQERFPEMSITDDSPEADSDIAFAIDFAELEALADRVVGVGPHAETLPLQDGRLTEAGFWEWWRRYDVLKPAADGALTWIPPMFRVPSFEQMWADA